MTGNSGNNIIRSAAGDDSINAMEGDDFINSGVALIQLLQEAVLIQFC